MVHKGEIVEKAVRSSGMSITELSKRLGISRRHIYNIFNSYTISLELVLQIGKIINYDFTLDFSEISNTNILLPENNIAENSNDTNANYWKNKYLALLEEYNKLLKELVGQNNHI